VEVPDEDVVARVLGGEKRLFEVLMRRYNQRLFRVARSVLRDDAEAEDVMQQAFVEAFTHLGQFEGRASFSTWLTKIALHEALARLRRRGRQHRRDDHAREEDMEKLVSADPNPEQQMLSGQLRALLEAAVDALPQRYRSVFVLREVEGLSTAESAQCLGVRPDVVKTRLLRARALLREELAERAGVVSAAAFTLQLSRCDRVVAAVFARVLTPPETRPH
jgi:RNA polymerase sigma-70 factor, ECF subfamily